MENGVTTALDCLESLTLRYGNCFILKCLTIPYAAEVTCFVLCTFIFALIRTSMYIILTSFHFSASAISQRDDPQGNPSGTLFV